MIFKKIFKNKNKIKENNVQELEESKENGINETSTFIEMNRSEALSQITLINSENLLTTTKENKETIKIADGILENKFFLMNSLDVIQFGKEIDWNYVHPNSANTYRLYIQCLNVISHLVDAYRLTNKKKYLIKAKEILWDWRDNIMNDNTQNKYKWVDHSVANRVMNIIYLYIIGHDVITLEEEIIVPILIKHGEFLDNDKNYRPNNHGIMVDRSLIYLSTFLKKYKESDRWFQKAKLRVTNAVYRDFSSKGVHLENSPSYHTMTRRMFNELERYLKSINLTLGKEVRQKLIQSNDYISYIMKPNNELPIIGDTKVSKIKWIEKSFDSFQDEDAGITILQNKAENPELSTWLAFISGYGSSTHKHRDDLSVSLYHKGEDIFVDSGRYNYDNKDKIRQYLLSPQAHSTLTVSNSDYKIEDPYKFRNTIKTTDFTTNSLYSYVKGINNAYENCELSRSLLFLKPELIIIKDRAQSEEITNFEQIFNIAPQLNVQKDENNDIILTSEKNKVSIRQLINRTSCEPSIITGDENIPRAIVSYEFSKLIRNNQIVYKASGNEVEFITIINLNHHEQNNFRIDYNNSTSLLDIDYNGQNFKFVI